MIVVEADPRDLERVMRKLQSLGVQPAGALRNAINTTATAARKMLAQKAQERYTVKNAGFNKHTTIQRASPSRLAAVVRVRGGPLTLPRFHTTAPKSGVRAEVLRGSGLKVLVNAAGNRAFRAVGNNGNKLIFQRKGRERYPLRALYGPSAAKMVEKAYGGADGEAGLKEELARLYRDQLQRQINKAVRG